MPTAEHAEEDAALRLLLDQPDEIALVGDADVEIAVGGEDHAVDAALDEMLRRDLVGQLDALRAVGRAAGLRDFPARARICSLSIAASCDGSASPDAPA